MSATKEGGVPASNQTGTEEFSQHATVTISLDGSKLKVADETKVKAGGRLTFEVDSSLTHFVICMKTDETPINGGHQRVGGTGSVTATIAGNANGNGTKKYSYAVMASDGNDVYSLDPDIVVGPT